MKSTPKKKNTGEGLDILIISLSGMGDVLLFTPALHFLREYLPQAHINFLVKFKSAAQVLTHNLDIDQIEIFDPKSSGMLKNLKFYLGERKKKYDISISTFPALTALNNLSTWAIGAKKRWIYNPLKFCSLAFLQNRTIPYYHGLHRIIYNLQLIKFVLKDLKTDSKFDAISVSFSDKDLELDFIDPNYTKPFYYINKEERAFAKSFLKEQENLYFKDSHRKNNSSEKSCWIGIHPGSGSDQSFKRWSERKFANLASQLQTKFECKIILFGGPDEVSIAKNIASSMSIPPIITSGKLNIRETAALIEQCKLFISNDSGLMHLSVAVGTKVIGIFGPTDETNTKPIGKDDKIIMLPLLPCKPGCRKRFLFDKRCSYKFRCLNELEVAPVLEAVSQSL